MIIRSLFRHLLRSLVQALDDMDDVLWCVSISSIFWLFCPITTQSLGSIVVIAHGC
jgi:hypothetical protein